MTMKHPLRLLLIALASFYLGWLAHDRFAKDDKFTQVATSTTRESQVSTTTEEPLRQPEEIGEAVADPQNFLQLLANHRFEEAVQRYERIAESDEQQALSLRADLLAWLQNALARGDDENLVAMADAWLARYYDDIDVLMILAEYQRRQGYPDEAARVVQFALTYALQAAQRDKVSRFFQSLVKKTDAAFSGQQQWIELVGFYQLLESIGLSQPRYQLRHAEVCLELGDFSTARELLMPLTAHVTWAGKANELLALTEQQAESVPAPAPRGDGIPLRRRGGHYLVEASLNNVSDVTLMIDTGASITSVSQDSFAELSRSSFFEYLGWRLFNTVNGMTRGNIYRASQLRLATMFYRVSSLPCSIFDRARASMVCWV